MAICAMIIAIDTDDIKKLDIILEHYELDESDESGILVQFTDEKSPNIFQRGFIINDQSNHKIDIIAIVSELEAHGNCWEAE